MNLNIYLNSLSLPAFDEFSAVEILEINSFAKLHRVTLDFKSDFCRIDGAHLRRIKVPKSAYKNSKFLKEWIYKNILKFSLKPTTK
jgi:hypothetical protein|nr:MAG TPA: hypothetical protein [Caudoviricetes sp.]